MLNDKLNKQLIGTTWLAGNSSCTLVIPKSLAQEYGLDKPSNVVIQGRPEGILITKLRLENAEYSTGCPDCGVRNRVNTEKDQRHRNGSSGLAAKQLPLDPASNLLVFNRHDNPSTGPTCPIGSEYQ